MKEWEYQILEMPIIDRDDQEMWLNDMGQNGWEMCGLTNTFNAVYVFFKREVKDDG